MILGLILSLAGIAALIWAMLRLAMVALPIWLGLTLAFALADRGVGGAVAIPIGLSAAVAGFLLGRLLVSSHLSWSVRAGVAALFAVPAGIAGYSIVSGLMRLGGAGPTGAMLVAVAGAIIIAITALGSLIGPAPRGAGQAGQALPQIR